MLNQLTKEKDLEQIFLESVSRDEPFSGDERVSIAS
ncbi:MAG: hypothetical protein RL326_1437, partial [Pseudomonadota bacterium]